MNVIKPVASSMKYFCLTLGGLGGAAGSPKLKREDAMAPHRLRVLVCSFILHDSCPILMVLIKKICHLLRRLVLLLPQCRLRVGLE